MSEHRVYKPNQPYHLYNRGTRKQRVFFETENYRYLLRLFAKNRAKYPVNIFAYALMPNHYHLLLSQQREGNGISRFLRSVFQSYSQAINRRYDYSGRLFESRPRAVEIHSDSHCAHICRYIHLNPVVANLVEAPADWEFSNYREFIGSRQSPLWNPEFVQTYFPSSESYENFVLGALEEQNPDPVIEKYLLEK